MPLIIPQESGPAATVEQPAIDHVSPPFAEAWRVVGWLGVAFFAMGIIDILIGWYPVRFGSAEWEFGTIASTVGSLSIPTLGLYLVLCSAISRKRAGEARMVGVVMTAMGVVLLGLAILYLTRIPLALRAVASNDMASLNMKKSIMKWLVLFVGYEALYLRGALKSFRSVPYHES